MPEIRLPEHSSRVKLIAAFAAVYIIWGSTYLAIKFAIETIPPYLLAGMRYLVAGTVLYSWARLRGASHPTLIQWRSAVIIGILLLVGGNATVVWAEQYVASGLAALLVATEPLWIVILNWLRPGGVRPTRSVTIGMIAGFSGVALLIGPGALNGGSQVHVFGAIALVLAALSWAAGSIYANHARLPVSPVMASASQMVSGGVILTLMSVLAGEPSRLEWSAISLGSVLSLGYLIVFGSLIGFTAYVYLMRSTTPAKASTYAYVNPVIAVLLGWALAGEAVTGQMLLAMVIIIAAVAIITIHQTPAPASDATDTFPFEAKEDDVAMRNAA
jgi:drug/metabolite transporter (DMT)-like permease